MDKSEDDAWAFLEDLADKTMQQETVHETPSLNSRIQASRSCVHAIDASTTAEVKLAAVMKRLEALECRNQPQVDLVSLPEEVNATFGRPGNNPYSNTYNPGWRNHPNFSWS